MPYVRKTKRKLTATRKLQIVVASIVAVLLTVGFAYIYGERQAVLAENAEEAQSFTPAPLITPGEEDAPEPAPVTQAVAALADTSKPWTLAVIGDSTGNEPEEWVYLTVTRWAEQYDRPAVIHNWSNETNAYTSETSIPGAGEPIIVWNGSASGMNTEYSQLHKDVLVPERPNLVIVNHGHNHADPSAGVNGVEGLVTWATRKWETPPAIAVTLQNPRTDDRADSHKELVDGLRAQFGTSGNVALIDAYSAFESTPDVTPLLRGDGFHPSPEGATVWAEAVTNAIG